MENQPVEQQVKQVFNFENNNVRTVNADGEVWFAAIDVAKSLGLSNTTVAVGRLDPDEVTKFNLGGLEGETNFVSEPGLYRLIGASRKSQAKRFDRWVRHEVLPTIRKTGMYATPTTVDKILGDPDTFIQMLTRYKDSQADNQRLHDENAQLQQTVADYRPRVDYLSTILATHEAVTTTQIAADYNMSANALNKILHRLRVQHKTGGQWILYMDLMGKGYTKSDTTHFYHSDGRPDISMTTKWTQKGRMFIYEKLSAAGYHPQMDLRNGVGNE